MLTWKRDDPLMNYVVLDDVALQRPGRLVVPPSATVLAVGVGGPLIAEVRGATGLRHVSVSFDVLQSRWPHHWSFQVFMVNALETLGLSEQVGAGEAALAYRTGESAAVPAPGGAGAGGGAVRYVGADEAPGRSGLRHRAAGSGLAVGLRAGGRLPVDSTPIPPRRTTGCS